MRVFVTGASGHIGSALVPELLGNGHQVVGLARSDRSAAAIEAAGAEVARGDLTDPDRLGELAADADGVIHLAFNHEAIATGDFESGPTLDIAATRALAEALKGTDKPLVTTGGTLMLAMSGVAGRVGTEEDVISGSGRVEAENLTVALADEGVRSSVIRLSPTVHSDLDHHGFIPTLIGFARQHGVSSYVGDGATRWPAVGTRDAARLYRLALESAPAGSRLHGVAEEGNTVRAIAEAIGRGLGVPVESVAPEQAEERLGFLAGLAQMDNPTSSALTRSLVGWTPTDPGLLEDIDQGHYFATVTA